MLDFQACLRRMKNEVVEMATSLFKELYRIYVKIGKCQKYPHYHDYQFLFKIDLVNAFLSDTCM
jgi:hypothetical protein